MDCVQSTNPIRLFAQKCWTPSGHQADTKRTPSGHQTDYKNHREKLTALFDDDDECRMPITTVTGDILTATERYIVQQNCCTAVRAHGLSSVIATAMLCDPYATRRAFKGNWAMLEDRPEPGSLLIFEREKAPHIVCAFAQYCHGKPGVYLSKDPLSPGIPDGYADRRGYFKSCLELIADLKPVSVAFPYKIGCGLAGGSWPLYEAELNAWSVRHPEIDVKIYRLAGV